MTRSPGGAGGRQPDKPYIGLGDAERRRSILSRGGSGSSSSGGSGARPGGFRPVQARLMTTIWTTSSTSTSDRNDRHRLCKQTDPLTDRSLQNYGQVR